MKTVVVLMLIFLGFSVSGVHAQMEQLDTFSAPAFSISLQPEYPRPGEIVTATLADYGSRVYGSSISWFRNDEEIVSARNQREITLVAGDVDSPDDITVVLVSANGAREFLQATISPVYLDVIIEPQTRVPSFYLGRALPSLGSVVNATALINGRADTSLVYTWRVEQTILESGPIRGTNQVSFPVPMGSQLTLALHVSEPTGALVAKRAVLIPSVSPTISFYEVSTLFGMSTQAITTNLSLIGQSATIQAEPYYLDSRVYNNPDIKEWKINNRSVGNPTNNPYQITLQRTGTAGVSTVNFHVRDLQQVLQGAENSMRINY